MNWSKENLKMILFTIGSGFFIFYHQELIRFLIELLISVSKNFSDFYYSEVAINNTSILNALSGSMILGVFVLIIFFAGYYLLMEKREVERNFKLEELDEKNDVEKKRVSIKEKMDNIRKNARRRVGYVNLIIKAYIIFTSLFVLYSLVRIGLSTSVESQNILFMNKTEILLPYVGQEEINKLKSSWRLMENSEDFDQIQKYIEDKKNEFIK